MESLDVAKVAVRMALSSREEEDDFKERYASIGVYVAAVDFGGEFNNSVKKLMERVAVAARREGVVSSTHVVEGAIYGATREAISQITPKAMGLNVGGKVGIARSDEHICVAMFFGVGLLNLNDVTIGLGHRSLPSK